MLDSAEDRINRQKDANCQVKNRLLTTFFRRLIHFLRICILIFNSGVICVYRYLFNDTKNFVFIYLHMYIKETLF
jgi:hypothetical protein